MVSVNSEMTFNDYEPEDAWDPDDDVQVQLENLRRRVRLLYLIATEIPQLDSLADIALAVIVAHARADLTERDRTRINDLFDDIVTVRERS